MFNLYYNDFGFQQGGLKTERVVALIDWLKSENVPIHAVTPGDVHYQTAQRFIDRNLDLMVTELDIGIPMVDGVVYRSVLDYVFHFAPRTPALLTWGFIDRYSWIPAATNHTEGESSLFHADYQPKPAYWQMQEDLARVLANSTYRLSSQAQTNKCLGILLTTVRVILFNAYSATASMGTVKTDILTGNFTQEWVISHKGNATYRIGPRDARQRVLAVDQTSTIVIMNYSDKDAQISIINSS
ncbi:hypothetical protein I4U23_023434 [Adineta vaga]|nr:hypothetical protein I4U23_023434 [Adineta vaga]